MTKLSRLGALLALALAAVSLTACDKMNSNTPTTSGTTGPASAASR